MTRALTTRELQILDGVRRHRTYAEIGEACSPAITEETVRKHVKNIARKVMRQGDEKLAPREVVYDYAREHATTR